MACMIAAAEPTATTQLTGAIRCRVIQYEDTATRQSEGSSESKPRMSWVVVAGKDGRRQLRIQWNWGWRTDVQLAPQL